MNKEKEKNLYTTTKIWKTTLGSLRLLSGYKQKSMVKIMDELVSKEVNKVRIDSIVKC